MRPVILGASLLALFSSAAVADEPAAQQPLNLTCFGGGTANKPSVAMINNNAYGSGVVGTTPYSGSATGTSTVIIPHSEGFADQVDIHLFSGDDRIRLPRTILPGWHGGDQGWFKLTKIEANGRSISASATVNLFNHPKIYIDRVTGTISISSKTGDYSGQCQAVTVDAPAKF